MFNKLNFKNSFLSYILGIGISVMTYWILTAVEVASTVELKKRELAVRRIIPSYNINIVDNMISFELMLTFQIGRGGSFEQILCDFLIKWLLEYIMPLLPTRLLKFIVWFTRLKIMRILGALAVASVSVLTVGNAIQQSNNTFFSIPLNPGLPWNQDLSHFLEDLPPCHGCPKDIFQVLVKGKLTGDELDEAIDDLIAFIEDPMNGATITSVIVCLALLLASIFGVNSSRYHMIIERLWRAYKAGKLSKSRYLALARMLLRKKIKIRR